MSDDVDDAAGDSHRGQQEQRGPDPVHDVIVGSALRDLRRRRGEIPILTPIFSS
jgi:hypothetical protein